MAEKVSVEIGNSQYNLSQETQNLLKHISTSSYPHSRSVLIIQEPHEFAAAQFSLYKGLERFFEDNTSLIGKTVFLAEGTPANQPISVQSLVAEESHPSDEIIKQTLATFLITGYMAYEWKYQHGTSIIGTEDRALYDMSRQFAAVCRRTPNAIFEKLQYKDGTEFPIPLGWAWVFAVTARNKSIAETLIEKTKEYENPILFVGGDHLKRMEDSIFALIKDEMIDAAFRGPEGIFKFPAEVFGGYPRYFSVRKDCENFGIHHYLEKAHVGYTFLDPIFNDTQGGDEDMYEKLLRTQAENAFESVKDFGIKEYIQWFLSNKTSNTTVQPDPEAAADFVRMLKEQNRSSGSRRGDIFNQGLRENSESNLGVTDPNEGHQTQVYPDNYRVSRDGENGVWHWTNQNLPKGHPDRHNPPEDTRTQP